MPSSPSQIAIFLPLAIGVGMTVGTIVIHGLALVTVPHFVRRERRLGRAGVRFWTDVSIVVGATLMALAAHMIEITAWAELFVLVGEFADFATAFYHSAVNYTSLGYGDVVMTASWKLLGPLETADGLLMFGVS